MNKKLAIIGATKVQLPLVLKAKEMGIYTICFAWEEGAVCKNFCDKFYPISIIEKEKILKVCVDESINGVLSISSDKAMPTVSYINEKIGLQGNSTFSTLLSTNKFEMRKALNNAGIPCPKYRKTNSIKYENTFSFPFMVKAVDNSGSLGVTFVSNEDEYSEAFSEARKYSSTDFVIIEEYFEGRQFSFEVFSQKGVHHFTGLTEEFYTNPPYFIEEKHLMPGRVTKSQFKKMFSTVCRSLDTLGISEGASHSEIRINDNEEVCVIEIAGRMGGDFRFKLIELSSGIDFLSLTIKNAIGEIVNIEKPKYERAALLKWILSEEDYSVYKYLKKNNQVVQYNINNNKIIEKPKYSSQRFGNYIITMTKNQQCLEMLVKNAINSEKLS